MRLDKHRYWMCGIKIISYLTFIARFDMLEVRRLERRVKKSNCPICLIRNNTNVHVEEHECNDTHSHHLSVKDPFM